MQLKPAVAELMAAVRALPPLSMEALGAAARLSLPQIGCSNPGWVTGMVVLNMTTSEFGVIACTFQQPWQI